MRAVQGAIIVASSVQIILGFSQMWAICSRYNIYTHTYHFLLSYIGIDFNDYFNLTFFFRFFSPVGMVPVIALTGFGLFNRGFPVVNYNELLSLKIQKIIPLVLIWQCFCLQVGNCVEIGIPMLILFVIFSQVSFL